MTNRSDKPLRQTFILHLTALGCVIMLVGTVSSPAQTATCTPTATPSPTPPGCQPFNYPCAESINEDEDTLPLPSPVPVLIPQAFQPPDGSKLKWRIYSPDTPAPWPTIILIHGGGFHGKDYFDGGVERVAADLRNKGYYVLSVNYRLSQCGRITGQDPLLLDPTSGRPPQQTDDIKSEIRAARADTAHCNGRIGVIGGSAGGSHAVFVALDKTTSPAHTYPNWCQNSEDDRPSCAVGLSGAYDLSDRDGETTEYLHIVENYTNTCLRVGPPGGYDQKSVSPIAKLQPESVQAFKPIFLINSDGDSMPPHQVEAMRCALVDKQIANGLYEVLTLEMNNHHAFSLWRDSDGGVPPKRVRDRVVDFFDSYLKN